MWIMHVAGLETSSMLNVSARALQRQKSCFDPFWYYLSCTLSELEP